MITDALLLLSDAQASVRAVGTYVSTNTIDLGVARDIGAGEGLYVLFTVDVAFAGGTGVDFQIITSAAANLGSPTVLATSGVRADALLVVGYNFFMPVPPVVGNGQRYLGVQYVGTGTHTLGSVSARVVLDAAGVKYYASGYSML